MASTPPAGSDQLTPDWDKFPSLDGIGEKQHVKKKGSADFANWAVVCTYMRKHAKGWQPAFKTWFDSEGREHRAFPEPDGTASVVVFWRAPEGSGFLSTEDYAQPILFQNKPKQFEQCSSLIITNAIKRGWAAAASVHFGLFAELWSKNPMECPFENEDLMDEPAPAPKAAAKKAASSNKTVNKPPQADQTATAEGPSVQEQVAAVIRPLFQQHGEPAINAWRAKYKAQFKLSADVANITGANITTPEQFAFTENFLNEFIQANPA